MPEEGIAIPTEAEFRLLTCEDLEYKLCKRIFDLQKPSFFSKWETAT